MTNTDSISTELLLTPIVSQIFMCIIFNMDISCFCSLLKSRSVSNKYNNAPIQLQYCTCVMKVHTRQLANKTSSKCCVIKCTGTITSS